MRLAREPQQIPYRRYSDTWTEVRLHAGGMLWQRQPVHTDRRLPPRSGHVAGALHSFMAHLDGFTLARPDTINICQRNCR